MSSRIKNLIVVFGLVGIAALGYYLYSQNKQSSLEGSSGSISTEAAAESAEFLRRLNELKQIDLDSSIFSDGRFQSFKNNRPQLNTEGVGRPNPFISVGQQ